MTAVADPTDIWESWTFEKGCWGEYLDTIRTCGAMSYDEVEPWAWARLRRELDSVGVSVEDDGA